MQTSAETTLWSPVWSVYVGYSHASFSWNYPVKSSLISFCWLQSWKLQLKLHSEVQSDQFLLATIMHASAEIIHWSPVCSVSIGYNHANFSWNYSVKSSLFSFYWLQSCTLQLKLFSEVQSDQFMLATIMQTSAETTQWSPVWSVYVGYNHASFSWNYSVKSSLISFCWLMPKCHCYIKHFG